MVVMRVIGVRAEDGAKDIAGAVVGFDEETLR